MVNYLVLIIDILCQFTLLSCFKYHMKLIDNFEART